MSETISSPDRRFDQSSIENPIEDASWRKNPTPMKFEPLQEEAEPSIGQGKYLSR